MSPRGHRRPGLRQLRAFAPYAAASALYVAIGVAATDLLLSPVVAIAYLLVLFWLVPAARRRLR